MSGFGHFSAFLTALACVAGVQRGGRRESENLCVKCEESAKRNL